MSPSSRTTSLTFRCPNDLADWLKAEAARVGWSVSELIVETLRRHGGWAGYTENRKDDDADV